MSALQQAAPTLFLFETHPLRVITSENGEPLLVGNDVCKAIGYADPTTAMRHCTGEMRCVPLLTAGGVQQTRVLSEADVMRLIVKTKLPAAQAFERFVFDEILPVMRKNAHYVVTQSVDTPAAGNSVPPTVEHRPEPPMVDGLPNFADRVAAARAWADAEEGRLQLAVKVQQLERQVSEQAPAVEALNIISNTDGSMCLRDAAKVLHVHYNELADLLFKQGWVYRRPGRAGYLARHDKLQAGYLAHKIGSYDDPRSGEKRTKEQVHITQRGLTKLACMVSMKSAAPPH
ncbi:phage antirepressor KilAC domain-containing protein [Massilia sp. Root335]|uniref:phage antirepressor KilAC domain-containing protein n=1 Tax=Massilia sp. Root335 TaxID=1736517 RepID=UPI0006F6EB0D|nr:phage antirepressor KilAC domain-containing protein [Massilia sp. Root335]KQV50051.1 hypothetical protein ASC93_11055 [Massilia sp. Root335]